MQSLGADLSDTFHGPRSSSHNAASVETQNMSAIGRPEVPMLNMDSLKMKRGIAGESRLKGALGLS